MAPWTYPVVDFRTGVQIADHIPFRIDSFTDQLGVSVGEMSGALPLQGCPIDPDEALLPWQRVIVPCYLTRPVGAYVVTAHGPFGNDSTQISFTAQRVDYVLRRRRIWSTLQFVQQDQLTIARAIIGYALGLNPLIGLDAQFTGYMDQLPVASRLPWWTLDDTLSGVLRDRLDNDSGYQMQQDIAVADALSNLSKLADGEPGVRAALGLPGSFDYRLDYTRDPGTGALGVTIRLGYPGLGLNHSLPLEYPSGNVESWEMALDANDTETMSREFGAGSGVERVMGPIQTDYTAHDRGWPLLMGSTSSTASEAATLAANSSAHLNEYAGPNVGWKLSVKQDFVGTFQLGDYMQLRVRNPRFRDLKVVDARLYGQQVYPSRQGRAGRIDLMVKPVTVPL